MSKKIEDYQIQKMKAKTLDDATKEKMINLIAQQKDEPIILTVLGSGNATTFYNGAPSTLLVLLQGLMQDLLHRIKADKQSAGN